MKYLFFLIVLLMTVSCKEEQPAERKAAETKSTRISLTASQQKNAGVKTGKLEKRTLSKTIRVSGRIDVPPQNLVSVSVPLGGFLKSTHLLPGMHLKKGEVIAVLEDQQYIQLQQDYLTAKTKLEMAEAEYQRQKELNENKAGSDKVLQQAKAEYQSQKIAVSAYSEKLKLISINPATLTEQSLSKNINLYAPFDGYVSKINVNIGKYANPADVLFELVNPEDIHLNLNVFEKDLVLLSVGQKLIAYTNSDPEKKYNCEIILISQDISSDRTAEIHCHFEKYDKSLLPGMYMNAEIELKNKEVFAVPTRAVVSYGAKDFLFVSVGENAYEMIEVSTGDTENEWTEVMNYSDFQNRTIVLDGAYTLLMNLKNTADE